MVNARATKDSGRLAGKGAFARIALACQLFFGGWFLFHGFNYWMSFYFDPSVLPGPGLVPALAASGVMGIVKVLEITIGLALLLDQFAALAIVAAWPITVVIAIVNASGGSAFGIGVAVVIIALNAIMSFGHLDRYRPMLVRSAGTPSLAGLTGSGTDDRTRFSLAMQLLAAAVGVGAATAVTFITLLFLN